MKVSQTLRNILVGIAFIGICALAVGLTPSPGERSDSGVWYSIIPPLLAITLALLTHRLLFSLGVAILAGGLLTSVPNTPLSISAWSGGLIAGTGYVWGSVTDGFNLQIIAFVVLILAMISVIVVAGGLQGIAAWLGRFAKASRSTQLVTALMGLAIFIDDYANTMIVGSTMRPVTDAHRISREKLAFLVDATSAPIAGTALISTWIGYEVGLFGEVAKSLGIPNNGYSMFLDALGFRFYCILMIIFVLVNVLSGRDYGPMFSAEARARKTGALSAEDAIPMTSKAFSRLSPDPHVKTLARIAIIPIVILFLFLLSGLWIDGGGMGKFSGIGAIVTPHVWRDVITNAENNVLILAIAGGLGLLASIVCASGLSNTIYGSSGY